MRWTKREREKERDERERSIERQAFSKRRTSCKNSAKLSEGRGPRLTSMIHTYGVESRQLLGHLLLWEVHPVLWLLLLGVRLS